MVVWHKTNSLIWQVIQQSVKTPGSLALLPNHKASHVRYRATHDVSIDEGNHLIHLMNNVVHSTQSENWKSNTKKLSNHDKTAAWERTNTWENRKERAYKKANTDEKKLRLTAVSFSEMVPFCIRARAAAKRSRVSVVVFRSAGDEVLVDAFLRESIAFSRTCVSIVSFPINLFTLNRRQVII